MEVIARLPNQSPKASRLVRMAINVKHKTPAIPNSKYEKPTWPTDLNIFAGNSNLYESLLGTYTNAKALAPGKQVHAHILLTGLHQNTFLRCKLLNMYVMCDSLEDARQLFDKIPKPNHDAFSWNVMIRGYATYGFSEEAIGIFNQMQLAGIQPDNFTFPFVFKACAGISALQKGYVQNQCCDEALELFDQMERAGTKPNSITVVSVLPACADLEALQEGKNIHDYVVPTQVIVTKP